jgi:hypothetical protein
MTHFHRTRYLGTCFVHAGLPAVVHRWNLAPCFGHSVEAATRIADIRPVVATDHIYAETNHRHAMVGSLASRIYFLYLQQRAITASLADYDASDLRGINILELNSNTVWCSILSPNSIESITFKRCLSSKLNMKTSLWGLNILACANNKKTDRKKPDCACTHSFRKQY